MNTYIQDVDIPIYISLQYGSNFLKFPINPDNLTKDVPSNSENVNIEGLGEVGIPTKPKLSKITIKSFFWHQNNLVPPFLYVDWLERWQNSKKPATLIVTRFNYSMQVTCENFRHWINAGEEKDIYFELQLKEYRPYGAKKLNAKTQLTPYSQLISNLNEISDKLSNTPFILVDIPRPTRNNIKKEEIKNPYITKDNETILTITKKITGTTEEWKLLYDENIEVLGNLIAENNEIKVGTSLILPKKWIENTSYNIEVESDE